MEVEDEIKSLIKVWIVVSASLTFCYFTVRKVPKGRRRLLSLLPIISLFTYLPLNLTSFHFVLITSGVITWLCSFKLLLFAFNQGPLSSNHSSMSFFHFVCLACLPIQIAEKDSKSPSNYMLKAFKALLLALVIKSYDYKQHLHPNFLLSLYCIYVYLALEILLAISSVSARAMFGFEMEPQFNEPYLATSLQDFWGKRWNLMFTNILRYTVYHPIRSSCTRILGRKYASLVASVTVFLVSGLIHELIYLYLSRVRPTWEVTGFFVLHGLCTALELQVKRALGCKWQLHPLISRMLTLTFLFVTAFWLFFPPIVRNNLDARAIGEYGLVIEFMKSVPQWPLWQASI